MASGSIVARIISQYSDKGSKAAAKDIDKLGKQFSGFGKKVAKAFAIGAAASAAFAVKIGVEAVQAAMEDQKSQAILANSLKNTTGASEEAIASVEKYIGRMQMAAGVADTELRTALSKLAAATGDVGQAQTLLGLALDVSAGSGKDLSSVSAALSKAMGGNYTAIAKLGIKGLDSASLKGMKLNEVMGKLADTFKGASATAAGTFQGQVDRLKLGFGEVLEQIGNFLLPYLQKLATIIIEKVVPAVQAWIEQNGTNVIAMFKKVIAYGFAFFSLLWDTFQFVARNAKIFGALGAIIVAAIFGSKVAGAVTAFTTAIQAIIKVMGLLRTASLGAAAAEALATGGASAAAGAAAFAVALVGIGVAVNKFNNSQNDATSGLDDLNTEFKGISASADDYTKGLGELKLKSDKLKGATDKLSAAEAKNLDLKKALYRLAQLGAVPTSETDPIQLEAARLNLLKQQAVGIEAMTNGMWAFLEAQFATNKQAQRYADILAVINDNKIDQTEVLALGYKWGMPTNAVLDYIKKVTGIKDITIGKDLGAEAASGWDKAKLSLQKYLAELGAGDAAQTAQVEVDLSAKAAADAQAAADAASKIADDAEKAVADLEKTFAKLGFTTPIAAGNAGGIAESERLRAIALAYSSAPTATDGATAAANASTSAGAGGVNVTVNAGNVVGSQEELIELVRQGILAGQTNGKSITLNSLAV
jgi:hypothetical protein